MAIVDLVMPKMGESIMEATILKWHKKPGDFVKMDETLLDIATDKVDSEVPSTEEGIVDEVLFAENEVVPIGAVIARIKTNVSESETYSAPRQAQPIQQTEMPQAAPQQQSFQTHTQPAQQVSSANGGNNRFYSPLVLNIAAQEGVSLSELEKINGTGNEGRVTK